MQNTDIGSLSSSAVPSVQLQTGQSLKCGPARTGQAEAYVKPGRAETHFRHIRRVSLGRAGPSFRPQLVYGAFLRYSVCMCVCNLLYTQCTLAAAAGQLR